MIARPQGLVPPCDNDENIALAEDCAKYVSSDAIVDEYFDCETAENTYAGLFFLFLRLGCAAFLITCPPDESSTTIENFQIEYCMKFYLKER